MTTVERRPTPHLRTGEDGGELLTGPVSQALYIYIRELGGIASPAIMNISLAPLTTCQSPSIFDLPSRACLSPAIHPKPSCPVHGDIQPRHVVTLGSCPNLTPPSRHASGGGLECRALRKFHGDKARVIAAPAQTGAVARPQATGVCRGFNINLRGAPAGENDRKRALQGKVAGGQIGKVASADDVLQICWCIQYGGKSPTRQAGH